MKVTYALILLLFITTGLFSQQDSSKTVRYTREFGLSEDYTEFVNLNLDTLLTGFQWYRNIEKKTPFYINLGNYGLPVIPVDFSLRNIEPEQYVYQYYKPYMHHQGNIRFVDTKVPFTEAVFTFGSPRATAEQTFKVRHSQSVNRYLNFGLDLDIINSLGQYTSQRTDDRFFTFHSSYTGRKYEILGAFNLNNITGLNNGGITDMETLTTGETRNIAVNLGDLNKATTLYKNKSVVIVQRFNIGAHTTTDTTTSEREGVKGTFSHIFDWESNRLSHDDQDPFSGFYDTTYISNQVSNNVPTHDSLFSRKLANTLRFDFRTRENAGLQLGLGAGIMNELVMYRQIIPTFDTLFSDTTSYPKSSNAILGKVYNRIGRSFGWEADALLYFTGYRSGDFRINGRMWKSFGEAENSPELYAKGKITNYIPSFWIQQWGSNNFTWNNDFGKEFRISVTGGFKSEKAGFDFRIDYSIINNFIFFGNNAMPMVADKPLSVIGISLDKRFSFWKLIWDNRVLIQKSGNIDLIDLPILSARSTFFINHQIHFKSTGGVLGTQLGIEGFYISPFYAFNYMPSTNVFYNQDLIKSGNYPYLNVFVNIKLKRTRFFLSFEHLNSGLMGNDYFIAPGYPMPVRTFRYGISWTFYN